MKNKLLGYKGEALRVLNKTKAEIGDLIRVTKDETVYEGTLIPRSGREDDKHIIVKLRNGYNIGVKVSQRIKIEKIGAGFKPTFSPPPYPKSRSGLAKVTILSTGGTIASRVDYRTGGVRPALSASDLHSVIPEISEIAEIDAEVLFSLFSENVTPEHWSKIAVAAAEHINKGVAGVVVAHGTDTMGYTAAALSFALQSLPVPVILVGSQRSSDRPSSDAAHNMIGAVIAAARAPFAEVVISMHENVSDESVIFHLGTKVRKCHTSRRDAFRSINTTPIARLEGQKFIMINEECKGRDLSRKLVLKPEFDNKVALIKSYPDLNPESIDWYTDKDYHGIVIEGTGLGHLGDYCFSAIKRAIKRGIIVSMTSQCIWGRVNMKVYDTGRDLLALGVIPLKDMLPETALVKLMWVLGSIKPRNLDEAKRHMLTNYAGETTSRSVFRELE